MRLARTRRNPRRHRYEEESKDDLLSPCEPGTIYCIGRNYAEKIDQMEYDIPELPDFFIKPSVAAHPPDTEIAYPEWCSEFTYAGELAAVIERECHCIDPENVDDYVLGYTIMNDLDAIDQERRTARKSFDGSAPLGPWIETDVDTSSLEIETRINGEIRQDANTDQMIFTPDELISFLSERFTLKPDDVIAFGSPANPGSLERGDEVEIKYEGIGVLCNTVV